MLHWRRLHSTCQGWANIKPEIWRKSWGKKRGTSLEKEPTSNYGQEFEVVESSSSWEQDEKEVVSATFKDDEETNSLVKTQEEKNKAQVHIPPTPQYSFNNGTILPI